MATAPNCFTPQIRVNTSDRFQCTNKPDMAIPNSISSENARAHLAAIVESSEDAIISKTLDGTILTWNAGAERVYGYPAAEAIGCSMTMLLPADRPDEENE